MDLSGSNIQALGFGLQNGAGAGSINNVYGTFKGASKLTDITLPATCSQFGMTTSYFSSAFANCTSLNNINYKNFAVNTTPDANNNAPTGFDALDINTWRQVANIMNAFTFFGQTTINADGTVNPDPLAQNGSWASTTNTVGLNTAFGQAALLVWGQRPNNNNYFNYPINVYPSGNYSYYTTAPDSAPGVGRVIAEDSKKTVSYAAGLGMAVEAKATAAAATGQLVSGDDTTLNVNSSNLNDNTAIKVPTTSGAVNGETITISGTRPQSVWYTVGQPENSTDNIYIPTANKLVGTANNNALTNGGSSWTSIAPAQTDSNTSTILLGQVTTPNPDGGAGATQQTNQNFYALPLGITANTQVAYFNHNNVVWKYTNDNKGNITIEGWVNGYIGGEIQSQGQGVGALALSSVSSNANNKPTIEILKTQNGVYEGGAGLTSVGSINGSTVSGGEVTSPNIGGTRNTQNIPGLAAQANSVYINAPFVCLFGSKVKKDSTNLVDATGENYSATVAPKAIKVTLTLTTNGQ